MIFLIAGMWLKHLFQRLDGSHLLTSMLMIIGWRELNPDPHYTGHLNIWQQISPHCSTLHPHSNCGDVVDPHFKCGGPHIIRTYQRMNVNLHYSDPQYMHLFTFEMWKSTLLHNTSTLLHITSTFKLWRCGGSTLHPHVTCEGQHYIHISSDMDTFINIRSLNPILLHANDDYLRYEQKL